MAKTSLAPGVSPATPQFPVVQQVPWGPQQVSWGASPVAYGTSGGSASPGVSLPQTGPAGSTAPVTTTNTTTPDPGIKQYEQQYQKRLQQLWTAPDVQMDPNRMQHTVDMANATAAQAAAGQQANNARYASQLGGGPEALAALNRRTTEQQAAQMASTAANMTEAEQKRLDMINEARRQELNNFIAGGLAGAQAQAGNALAKQQLGLQQMGQQQNYGLGLAQLQLQQQQQEWARQQALLQLQLQTAQLGGQTYGSNGAPLPVTPAPTSSGAGLFGGTPSHSGGGLMG